MQTLIFIFAFVNGGLLRRFWGGWETAGKPVIWHYIKIMCVVVVGMIIGFVSFGVSYATLICAFGIVAAFLNPFHGKGQNMGTNNNPNVFWSIIWMSGSYGFYTAALSALLFFYTGQAWVLCFAPFGLLASVGYLIGWYPLKNWLIAHPIFLFGQDFEAFPTEFGEVVLGTILISGLPFAKLIAS